MNEQKVRNLVTKLKVYVNQLESELACAETYGTHIYNSSLHNEIKLYEEWYSEEDETLCP